MSHRLSALLFSALVLYLTLFYQLGNMAFVGADEARYARVGQEMLERGDYVTPTLEYRPWLEKPPLLFWMETVSFRLLGVSEGAARLPAALSALVGIGAVVALVGVEGGVRAGLLTLLILATSSLYFVFGRAASTDMPLTAALALALVTARQACRGGSLLQAAAAGTALALALLAKGPVALVLFGGIWLVYFLLSGCGLWNVRQWMVGSGCLLLGTFPWYWRVWQANGYDFVVTFWINHHLARFFTSIHHHTQPFWFFLPVLIVGVFPWVFLSGSSLARLWRGRRHLEDVDLELFLWLWVGVPLLFFSLAQSKLPGYILPAVPALAALAALEWDRWTEGDLLSHRWMGRQLLAAALLAPFLGGGLLWGFWHTYQAPGIGLLLLLPLAGSLVWACREYRRRRAWPLFFSLVAGMTLLAGLAVWKAAPRLDDYHSSRDLVRRVLPHVSAREPLVLYRYFHHTALYYSEYRATEHSIDGPRELDAYQRAHPQRVYYLLTHPPGWRELERGLGARLLARQGNLCLVVLEGPCWR